MEKNRFELFSTGVAHLVKTLQYLKSRKMGQYDLKGTTCLCLCLIFSSEEGLTAGELSSRGDIDKAQVSRCMTELMQRGFIYRDDRNGHRYRQKYLLTEAGREAASDISATTLRIQQIAEQGVSEEDLQVFYSVLTKMCDNFGDVREYVEE